MYSAYDPPSSRSPGSHRHQPQTLHRQSSRQFDAYSSQLAPGGLYTPEDHARGYEQPRNYERPNATIHAGYGYDMGTNASNAWNTNVFAQNSTLSSLGGPVGRIKQSGRGRSQLPSVCRILGLDLFKNTDMGLLFRAGLINLKVSRLSLSQA